MLRNIILYAKTNFETCENMHIRITFSRVENGSKLKLYSFFEMLEDSGCKFKLNFDWGGGQK